MMPLTMTGPFQWARIHSRSSQFKSGSTWRKKKSALASVVYAAILPKESRPPAIVEAIGLGAAIDYVNSIGKERIAAHENDLLTYAEARLREINSLRMIGTAKGKGPLISFEMKGAHPHDVATVIDRQGIAVRAGTHCVMPLLERFNVTATCRASFGMYNTREEVDHLAQALIKARELFS